jgi:hypothetical protein
MPRSNHIREDSYVVLNPDDETRRTRNVADHAVVVTLLVGEKNRGVQVFVLDQHASELTKRSAGGAGTDASLHPPG